MTIPPETMAEIEALPSRLQREYIIAKLEARFAVALRPDAPRPEQTGTTSVGQPARPKRTRTVRDLPCVSMGELKSRCEHDDPKRDMYECTNKESGFKAARLGHECEYCQEYTAKEDASDFG